MLANDNYFYSMPQAYVKRITFYINKIDTHNILTCTLQQLIQYWWLIVSLNKLIYCPTTQKPQYFMLFTSQGCLASLPNSTESPDYSGKKSSDDM